MVFGNSNIKIMGLQPLIRDNNYSLQKYGFDMGIERKFAKKAYQMPMTNPGFESLQNEGQAIIKEVMKVDMIENPYKFVPNEKGLTFLIASIDVSGNSCDLGLDGSELGNIEEELEKTNEVYKYLTYVPHNVDSPSQAYLLLSLFLNWENLMDCVIKKP
jgi:hypothetical protein